MRRVQLVWVVWGTTPSRAPSAPCGVPATCRSRICGGPWMFPLLASLSTMSIRGSLPTRLQHMCQRLEGGLRLPQQTASFGPCLACLPARPSEPLQPTAAGWLAEARATRQDFPNRVAICKPCSGSIPWVPASTSVPHRQIRLSTRHDSVGVVSKRGGDAGAKRIGDKECPTPGSPSARRDVPLHPLCFGEIRKADETWLPDCERRKGLCR